MEIIQKIKNHKFLSTEKYHPDDFIVGDIYTNGRDIFSISEDNFLKSYDPIEWHSWVKDGSVTMKKIYRQVFENPIENSIRFVKEA